MSVAADGDLGAALGGLTLGDATTGGTLATTASLDSARTVTLASGGGGVDTAGGGPLASRPATGAAALTETGTGTPILSATTTIPADDGSGGTLRARQ